MQTQSTQIGDADPTYRLSERAILVDLSIGKWSARRKDAKVTAEVAKRHKTDKRAGNYRKNLLPFAAPSYEAVLNIINEARDFHRENTLPWSDTGLRVLPNANFEIYMAGTRERERKFREAVDTFIPEMPAFRDEARAKLNGMFNATDYPEEAELRAKFSFQVVPYPLPETDDLRVQLTDNQVDVIRDQVAYTLTQNSRGILFEAWNRLLSAVQHAGAIFKNPSARVTRALFENLTTTCDLLERLNPTGDPDLVRMNNDVRANIASLDRKKIRKSKDDRAAAAAEVARIEKAMAGMMRGLQS